MDQFLAGIERRALVMAEMATRDREEALDLIQDAMMAFAQHYGTRPEREWRPLFHRVLQNRIRDWHRRRQSRGRWWGILGRHNAEEEPDPIQGVADTGEPGPEGKLMAGESMERIVQALGDLPTRQQQAFLLRVWEGLSVEETARAMACSTGSVKTHLSRARASLRARLQDQTS